MEGWEGWGMVHLGERLSWGTGVGIIFFLLVFCFCVVVISFMAGT